MNETTELIVLPPPESVRTVFTTPLGLEPYLQQIRTQLDEFKSDVSTKKGRAALDAFVAGGMTEECAKLAVTLIAKKAIPAVSISY